MTPPAKPLDDRAPLLLNGLPGSPYTRKMVALLRYRRMAYRLVSSSTGVPGLPMARPLLLPTFYLPGPDGSLQAVTDSTPLVRRFEAVTTRLWMAWRAPGSTGPWPARAANACSPNADPNGTAIL